MPNFRRRAQRALLRGARRAATRPLHQPSYTYKRLELTRVREHLRALGERDPAWEVNDKDDAHRWAQRLGVRVPALVGIYPRVEDLPWADLPDRVVLKPCRGWASRGVYLLERRGEVWRDLGTHRDLLPTQLIAELAALVREGTVGSEVLVEALVLDPRVPGRPPIDYKVHTFYGTVGMIEAKARGGPDAGEPTSWRVFDSRWRDLGNVFLVPVIDPSIPPPIHRDELLELARRISAAVPRAYLRVDLYDDASGPVFGEITPMPGSPVMVPPDVDRMLGQLWEEAEARLLARARRAGVLGPYTEPTSEARLEPVSRAVQPGVNGRSASGPRPVTDAP